MTSLKRVLRETTLWAGGVLGALCLLALLVGWLFNITPLVFASGSMSPTYDAGALGIAHEVSADRLAVGDVVSVINGDGDRVTHRIVTVAQTGFRTGLTLQGDTNTVPDHELYVVDTADRVVFGVPYVGYVLAAATTPLGLSAVLLLVGASLYLAFGRGAQKSEPGTVALRRPRLVLALGLAATLAATAGLGVSGQVPWALSSAYWTDTATVTASVTTQATLDTVPPTLTAFGPKAGDSRKTSNNGTDSWRRNCGDADNVVCLKATDSGSGVDFTSATFTLARTVFGSPFSCWDGSSFVSGSACSVEALNHNPVTGRIWSDQITLPALFPNGTYSLTWSVKDNVGNQATTSFSFTVTSN